MGIDRCTKTEHHSPHRAQYGPFGVKDCPGIPITPQNAPEVPAGPAPASAAAALFAEATRWRVLLPVGALKGIAEDDAYRLGAEHGVRPDRAWVRLYADGTEELGPWSPAPSIGSPADRTQGPTPGEARRLLDQAIDTALPLAGGRVRKLLKALRRELADVDVKRAEHARVTDERAEG